MPLERCRGRLQWERGVDEAAVVAEASRLWEGLRPLAEEEESLWQVLLDWLRAGFADYIQDMKLERRGEGMYATMEEAYAARRAEEAQRITIGLLTDYVRGRYGDAAGRKLWKRSWPTGRTPDCARILRWTSWWHCTGPGRTYKLGGRNEGDRSQRTMRPTVQQTTLAHETARLGILRNADAVRPAGIRKGLWGYQGERAEVGTIAVR